MHQEEGGPAAAEDGGVETQGSVTAGVIAGIVIPVASVPLVAIALPVAFFSSWWVLGELLDRPIHWYERDRGGMRMLADAVAVVTVGTIATGLAGVPLVKYIFRNARPDLLFRTGAAVLLLVAAAFWLWSTRNHPEYRLNAGWIALLGWLGSLLGLKLAAWETAAGKRKNALEDARWKAERKAEADALLREFSEPPEQDSRNV